MGTMTRRGMDRALAELEGIAVAVARSVPPPPFDEADWLARFTQARKEKTFAREPDFPAALAMLRDELATAQASAAPPFDPPEDFQSGSLLHIRRENWRRWPGHFPKLTEALDWLFEMLGRAERGIPPCSEAEFAELAGWFAAHEAGLRAAAGPSDLLAVGNGRRTWCSNVRYAVREGPRADGSGQVAEDIRQLRARYGGQVAARVAHPRRDT